VHYGALPKITTVGGGLRTAMVFLLVSHRREKRRREKKSREIVCVQKAT